MLGFICWLVIGILFSVSGIRALIIKEPFNFIKEKELNIKNIKKYNICIGILWILIGLIVVFIGSLFLFYPNIILILILTIIALIILFLTSLKLMESL